ncbi:MAG: murein hydrolase activator EnvC family protein [Bacillota bacterium]
MRRARSLRVLAAASIVALAASAASPPRKDAPDSTDALRDVRQKIEKLQKDLAKTEETRGGADRELRESDKAVSEAHRALFALREKRAAIEAELAAIGNQAQQARASVAEQQALAERLLRLQYEQGSTDRLRLLIEGRDAATVSRHLAYYGYIQQARADVIAALRGKAEKLAALDADARARRDELAANQDDQAREVAVLERERAARAATVKRLAGEIERGRREIGRLKRDEARLTRLVEEIARALAAKPAEVKPGPGRRVERVADASLASQPFASLKGRLRLPVRGELMGQFGAPREEGSVWKGLFIRCITGETVHAVADGRVVYADWLRGFGNLLILDHGGGYMSLYANNEGLLRQVGEKVRSGDPIAQVGASGGSAESGLYFELRRDGKPFDPMKWVTL